ncbi:Disease resistance protein L6 [Linum grandiflorum]
MRRSESDGSYGSSSIDSFSSCSSIDPTFCPLPIGEYEVFLSFRGPDVRNTFADHLYTCLSRSKIRTFRDEEELQKGETIGPSLVKAITESKIHIPILTLDYASSKWCLQEIAKMVECWKTRGRGNGQHIILPVFYFVNPRDVRHPDSGPYKKAFERHSREYDLETISGWKEALREVGKMDGWHVTESDRQGAVIDRIYTEVERRLRANYPLLTDELVGIDFHVEEVVKWLNLDSASGKIVGIHGMGGLGKTTLAKAVFNKVSTEFQHCCFLENIRETLLGKNGTVILQNKIISYILRDDSYKAKDPSHGIRIIRDRVCRHKVLIVLDDVGETFQFQDILGKLSDFSMDSRFLITTRDAGVLELLPECKLFELQGMVHDHALKLFSKHALGVDYPSKDYESLSEEFVQVAAGLPLALKVIGSLLFHTDKRFWEAKLIELKKIPPAKVQERLKISYDELNPNEKTIFLDVACLFVGSNKEVPIYMWSDCDLFPTSTIRALVQRSLVRINENGQFWMHDHVRDLGRTIVREENNNPYKHSRIWSNTDAIDMLKHKEGTNCVEALVVDMRDENLVLTNKEFKQLSRVRYLEVRNGKLAESFNEILPNLRWLRLFNCDSIPTSIEAKNLVSLEFKDCPVTDRWKGWTEIKVAGKLNFVSLQGCFNLGKVPDLSNCGGLERLHFRECWSMHGELDIGNFRHLRELVVSHTEITKLKGEIGRLQNLQYVDGSYSRLVEMPAGISNLTSLEFLDLTSARRKKPHLTERLPNSLKTLSISSSLLPSLPSSLNYVHIHYWEHPLRLPNLGNLTNLTVLRLSEVGIREIPGLGELELLETLYIVDAPCLDNLDGLERLVLLKELSMMGCLVLEKLPSLANLTKLHKLEIFRCWVLTEIHGVGELWESLSHLYISSSPLTRLTGMDTLHSMVKLENLVLTGLELTKTLPRSLSMFTKLRKMDISQISLKQFPDLSSVKNLKELSIIYGKELVEVTGLDTLNSLECLMIRECRSIRNLPDLSGLIKLKRLDVTGCAQLAEIRGLGRLVSLEVLWMSGCKSITELPNLSGLKNLTVLDIKKCRQLKEVNGIEELESLVVFFADKRLRVRNVLKYVTRYGKQLVTRSIGRDLS